MRVLDLNNNYSPVGGGVKTYHHKKLQYFAAKDGLVNGLMIPDDHEAIEAQGDGNVLYRVKAPPLGKNSGYRLAISVKRMRAVVDHFQPDIIEMGSVWALPWLMKRINPRGIPTVGFYHTDVPNTHVAVALKNAPQWLSRRPIARTYDLMAKLFSPLTATFGASEYVLRNLEQHGVKRLFHTPFGADTAIFRPDCRDEAVRESGEGAGSVWRCICLGLTRRKASTSSWMRTRRYDPDRLQLVIKGHGPGEAAADFFRDASLKAHRLDYLHDRASLRQRLLLRMSFVTRCG